MSTLAKKLPRPTALVIYDNFFFAERTNALFQEASLCAGEAGQWNVKPWMLDGLKLPSGADAALTEAAEACLIVFAGPRAQSLPFWLEEWLEEWVACRQLVDAAFAIIGGNNGESFTRPARGKLSRFAGKHGLNFIVKEDFAAEDNRNAVAPGDLKMEPRQFQTQGSSTVAPT